MRERILEMVQDATGCPVTDKTCFIALNIDSLEFVQLIIDVENLMCIKIDEKQIANINTVGDLLSVAGV